MSDTPRTDAVDAVADENYGTDMYRDMLEHARKLERKLARLESANGVIDLSRLTNTELTRLYVELDTEIAKRGTAI